MESFFGVLQQNPVFDGRVEALCCFFIWVGEQEHEVAQVFDALGVPQQLGDFVQVLPLEVLGLEEVVLGAVEVVEDGGCVVQDLGGGQLLSLGDGNLVVSRNVPVVFLLVFLIVLQRFRLTAVFFLGNHQIVVFQLHVCVAVELVVEPTQDTSHGNNLKM